MLPRNLEGAIYGLVTTPVLRVADQHGILSCLVKSGPLPSSAVADQLGFDADTVERLLLVLTAFRVLERDRDGSYLVPDEHAGYFDSASAHYVGGFLDHMVTATTEQLGRIDQYLRRGKAAVDAGLPTPYENFYRDEESTREFMDAMWHLSYGVSQELVALADLAGACRLVDVGGANGPFSVAALQQVPGLRAVVFDLPQVAPHLDRSRWLSGLGDRLDFVAGDFFHDELPAGDVMAFGYVMSNWPDEECVELLRKAHHSCTAGGRVLLMERLFDDDRSGPVATSVMNLMMHVETRGRHRTVAEYFGLLAAAGFTGCEVRLSTKDKHLLIGHKADQ